MMPTNKNPRTRAAANDGKGTVSINVALPTAVHRKLRVKALHENMTLAEAVTAAVTAWAKG